MHLRTLGFSPLKGGRHLARDAAELGVDGPVGDRAFALVDPAAGRVLRTVDNPRLLQAVVRWESGVLSAELPGGSPEGVPTPTGEVLTADYWSRDVRLEVVAGPWSEAFSAHLGRAVVLARATQPGAVVYGAPVTLVTTGSLRLLERRLGRALDPARFRATFVVDTDDREAHVEDAWQGRVLRLGEASVRVAGGIPRCAVVDLDPVLAERDASVLRTLGGYRRGRGEINFGTYAEVTVAGRVRAGDPVELGRD